MGQTVIEKIISAHTNDPVAPGNICWMELDVRSARDFGGANVVKNLIREYGKDAPVADPAKTFFTFDCNAPANTIPYANNQQICRDFARPRGIRVHDVDAGIGSHVVMEQGLCVPGATIVGTDSHMNILGAFGAFGQGMGDADIAYAFRWGRTWFEVPPSMKVKLTGKPGPHAKSKDINLAVLKRLGSSGALGRSVEFVGPVADSLDVAGRITLASQATEMGAIIGLLVPNQAVIDFCKARNKDADFQVFAPDSDAEYVEEIEINLDGLGPMVARPGSPADVTTVAAEAGRPIDSVFLGSCTNGRIEDFREAAEVLKGRRVKPGVMFRMAPATREVFGQMMKEGLLDIFFEAGAIISHQGCGGCASGQLGMTGKGEVQVSTSNRNFTGKQGDGDTYLASPATAAASAVAGVLTSADQLHKI
ncbi:MAG: 3-isopropylmalate dehydratase large subunit [Planctomycetes bacterium]|nr:3-isopropylmalate dehydratase large subunit [Planctomycetota bacterium]